MENGSEKQYDLLIEKLSQGLVCRQAWMRNQDDGCELACLLLTLEPQVLTRSSLNGFGHVAVNIDYCAAQFMPDWFARCLPWIDDSGTSGAWLSLMQQFARTGRRSDALADRDWAALRLRLVARLLRTVREKTRVLGAEQLDLIAKIADEAERSAELEYPRRLVFPEILGGASIYSQYANTSDAVSAMLGELQHDLADADPQHYLSGDDAYLRAGDEVIRIFLDEFEKAVQAAELRRAKTQEEAREVAREELVCV